MGDHKLAYREQITNFIFSLSAYLENTLYIEKSLKIDLSSLILDQNQKNL
jgi:hypothetical protein